MRIRKEERLRQRTRQVQGYRVRNKLGVFKEQRVGHREGEEGTRGVGQIIEGLVPMGCKVAFTHATLGSHQREANHYRG